MHRTAGVSTGNRGARIGGLAGAAMLSTVLVAGCASAGTTKHVPVPKPFPMPDSANTRRASPAAPPDNSLPAEVSARASKTYDSYALVGTALDLRGAPYLDGGASPRGFDCSGFTQYVFAQHGVALPRAVRDQVKLGKTVKPKELTPGDLLFFATTDASASHVAIAVGRDEFVHAPSSTGVVRVERLSANYWSRRFIGARRVR